jgi:hypothetical protein
VPSLSAGGSAPRPAAPAAPAATAATAAPPPSFPFTAALAAPTALFPQLGARSAPLGGALSGAAPEGGAALPRAPAGLFRSVPPSLLPTAVGVWAGMGAAPLARLDAVLAQEDAVDAARERRRAAALEAAERAAAGGGGAGTGGVPSEADGGAEISDAADDVMIIDGNSATQDVLGGAMLED